MEQNRMEFELLIEWLDQNREDSTIKHTIPYIPYIRNLLNCFYMFLQLPGVFPNALSDPHGRLGSIGDHQRVRHGAALSRNIRRPRRPQRPGRVVSLSMWCAQWVGLTCERLGWCHTGCFFGFRTGGSGKLDGIFCHHKVVLAVLLNPSVPLVLSETLQYSEGQRLHSKIMF